MQENLVRRTKLHRSRPHAGAPFRRDRLSPPLSTRAGVIQMSPFSSRIESCRRRWSSSGSGRSAPSPAGARRADAGTSAESRAGRAPDQPTTTTSSTRGPCTPSTRSSSMSEVADGPETNVSGRRAGDADAEPRDRLGDELDDLLAPRRRRRGGRARASARAGPGARPAVEDERARLGDRERAPGQHGVERRRASREVEAVVLDQLDARRAPRGRQARRDRRAVGRRGRGRSPRPRREARQRSARRTVAR